MGTTKKKRSRSQNFAVCLRWVHLTAVSAVHAAEQRRCSLPVDTGSVGHRSRAAGVSLLQSTDISEQHTVNGQLSVSSPETLTNNSCSHGKEKSTVYLFDIVFVETEIHFVSEHQNIQSSFFFFCSVFNG